LYVRMFSPGMLCWIGRRCRGWATRLGDSQERPDAPKETQQGHKVGRLKWQESGERRSVAYQSEGFNVDYRLCWDPQQV